MPHLIVEYSSNLEKKLDIGGLCQALSDAVVATGLFELGAIRVRAYPAQHYAIADALEENAFIDLAFRIGAGRTEQEKKGAGETIFAAAQNFVVELFASPHFALSFEIREIDPDLSWKRNAIHARLRDNA